MKKVLLLLLVLMACAPATTWTKTDFNQAVFDYDYGICKQEAEASVPAAASSQGSRLFSGFTTSEERERKRKLNEYMSSCLQRKGYFQG